MSPSARAEKKKGVANKKHLVIAYSLPFNGYKVTVPTPHVLTKSLCWSCGKICSVPHEKQDLLLQLLLCRAPSPYAHTANRQHHSVSGVSADPGWSEVKGSKAVVAAMFSC